MALWPVLGAVSATLAGTLWVARILLYALLSLLEPVVRVVLVPFAYLGFAVTLLFGFVIGDPRFPRWGMLGISVGALVAYWLYIMIMELTLPRTRNHGH
jgi:hypothetical protein